MRQNFLDLETIKAAADNLQHQGIRSYLTLLGIVIGIAAIIALVSIGQGMNAFVEKQFESLGLDNVFIEPGSSTGSISSMLSKLQKNDDKIVEGIPGVEAVIPLYETSGIATFKQKSASVIIIGYDPKKSPYLEKMGYLIMAKGRQLETSDKYGMIVSDGFVKDAFDQNIGLKEKININGQDFKIVGIMKQSDVAFSGFGVTNMVFMNQDTVKSFFDENSPTEIMVKVANRSEIDSVTAKIEKELERAHGEKDFTVMSTENIIESAGAVLATVQAVLIILALISLLVGGIGIMNTMLMSVTERTKEIGVMKAIGATNDRVLSIFLMEAGLIGLVGGIVGAFFGYLISFLVSVISSSFGFALPFSFDPLVLIGALAFAMVVGMVSGYLPARHAARMDPVEALRYE